MKRLPLAALALLSLPVFSADYTRHNFTFGAGAALPQSEIKAYFSNRPVVRAGYGFRFAEYFQLDAGFDTVFGAAGVNDYYTTAFGDLRIRDYQYFIPMGGRVVVALAKERVQLSAGGGGVYMRYSERIRQPFGNSGYRIDCSVCSSRDGWGYYALVSANTALDYGRHFRVGATGKVIRGHTDGDPLGAAPPLRTQDHWVVITGDFTFSF